MKAAVWIILVGTLLVGLVGLGKLRPLTAPGTAVHVGDWRIGRYEFQVWQRKNDSLSEPFASGLFFRQTNGLWRVVCLDHEDFYSPPVELREEAGRIVVVHWYSRVAALSVATGEFRGEGDNSFPVAVFGDGNPPGDWWTARGPTIP